jgi:hypothetical protein
MASIGSPNQNGKAYDYVDHAYDVIVVGAGGAGLRATLGMAEPVSPRFSQPVRIQLLRRAVLPLRSPT